MSHADMNNCCGFNEAAASFSWNSSKKAINPYLDPVEVAPSFYAFKPDHSVCCR